MGNENSIVSLGLGQVTKPMTKLIERVSEAIGWVAKPTQIVRVAKAQAKAELIKAEAQIQIDELQHRAARRWVAEETKKQANIEEITKLALPLVRDSSDPEKVAADWITHFYDKCRHVSDKEVQQMWSHLLAGEANAPGTFSKRSVNVLADLERRDAELFASVCRFAWVIVGGVPLIFDELAEIYVNVGVNFSVLSHLESLGLVHFGSISGFRRMKLPKNLDVSYFGKKISLVFPRDTDNEIELGKVRFTAAGLELASICEVQPVEGFLDFVCARWKAQGLLQGTIAGA